MRVDRSALGSKFSLAALLLAFLRGLLRFFRFGLIGRAEAGIIGGTLMGDTLSRSPRGLEVKESLSSLTITMELSSREVRECVSS